MLHYIFLYIAHTFITPAILYPILPCYILLNISHYMFIHTILYPIYTIPYLIYALLYFTISHHALSTFYIAYAIPYLIHTILYFICHILPCPCHIISFFTLLFCPYRAMPHYAILFIFKYILLYTYPCHILSYLYYIIFLYIPFYLEHTRLYYFTLFYAILFPI